MPEKESRLSVSEEWNESAPADSTIGMLIIGDESKYQLLGLGQQQPPDHAQFSKRFAGKCVSTRHNLNLYTVCHTSKQQIKTKTRTTRACTPI
jgi:hypothetical protein